MPRTGMECPVIPLMVSGPERILDIQDKSWSSGSLE